MKTTIIIETDSHIDFEKILESFRMIKGVKKVESAVGMTFEPIPGVPNTLEELKETIRQTETEHNPDKSTPHDMAMKMIKESIQTWK